MELNARVSGPKDNPLANWWSFPVKNPGFYKLRFSPNS